MPNDAQREFVEKELFNWNSDESHGGYVGITCRRDTVRFALHLLQSGCKRWRDCAVEMPEIGFQILFNIPFQGVEIGAWDGVKWISQRTDSYDDAIYFHSDQVMEWMPVPIGSEARAALKVGE